MHPIKPPAINKVQSMAFWRQNLFTRFASYYLEIKRDDLEEGTMKTAVLLALTIFLLAAISWAQVPEQPAGTSNQPASPAAPTSQASSSNQLASGTLIPAELSKSLDAKKAKANDKIEAKTSVDMLSHGQILVPRNTKIVGHVTEAKAHSKESPDSMVGITFDRIVMKDGRELPLQASVQAIGRPLQSASFGGNEPAAETPAGLPQGGQAPAGQGPRGSMGGAPQTGPSSYPSSYPTGNSSRYPSESNNAPQGSSVSPLGPTSQGAVGMKGVTLNASGPASVVSSSADNVHLDSGTQLILRVQ
jgi:hypothetical protein